ncbi:hypothetical protein AKJ09_01477 [Labilithrix luteola]|uniref:Type IV fimbrial biogenesis protein PilY1 n=2 Tax=Labilithrix luteola TaxID=1391654 RepID=A0A0K1PMR2_9BACT|nr:hypothetical protein AKJ09_01477 [Labilithrix luteola]
MILAAVVLGSCTSILAMLAACATDDSASPPSVDAGANAVPVADAGLDVDAEDVDAGPCSDCEWFPKDCTDDVLCNAGPYDSNSPGGRLDPVAKITVIRGRSPSDVWAAGELGAFAHFDGTSWSKVEVDIPESLHAIWLRSSSEITFGRLEHPYTRGMDAGTDASVSPGGWSEQVPGVTSPTYGPNDVIVGSAWASPNAEWLWTATRPTGSGSPPGLWRLRVLPSGVLELGIGATTTQCVLATCIRLGAIHGASADELWAVGQDGATVRVTAADTDSPVVDQFNSQTRSRLEGVWQFSSSNVWSVGYSGTVRHYGGQGRVWDVVSDVPTSTNLHAITATSPSDIWVVGDASTVLHFDGTSWTRVKIAGLGSRRPDLVSAWSPSPGRVWIGGQGVLLSLGAKP